MLITFITVLFCLAQDLVPQAAEWFVEMETTAGILALCLFTVVAFRVRSVARYQSPRAASR